MALKPLRPCRYPGCCALVPGGYCPQHRPKPRARSDEARAWRRLYDTDLWQRLRSEQLLADPWCAECAKHGRRVRATDVDHIVDHKGDPDLFADPANLQSLCHSCHSRKTAQDQAKSNAIRKRLSR